MMCAAPDPRAAVPLTPRQLEVARLLADGYSRSEIAAHLRVSVRAVRKHITDLATKIDGEGSVRRRVVAYLRRAA